MQRKLTKIGAASAVVALAVALAITASGDEKAAPRSFPIPYRLTQTKHLMVRVKVNGHGPYNLVIDTGAPAVIFAKKLVEPLGITTEPGGWATLDTFDIEGGLQRTKVTARFEDLFQLEGMNGLGLAGAEIHGLIGYPILARYRIEYDLTKPNLTWTEVDKEPDELPRKAGKGMAPAGLNALGSMMKGFGKLIGAGPPPPAKPRGFFGLTLTEEAGKVVIGELLSDGPAGKAGLRSGDVVNAIDGAKFKDLGAAEKLLHLIEAGNDVKLTIARGGETKEVEIKTGRGF